VIEKAGEYTGPPMRTLCCSSVVAAALSWLLVAFEECGRRSGGSGRRQIRQETGEWRWRRRCSGQRVLADVLDSGF
jgi:hypothetical protein